jgi:hypothetical protein
VTPRRRESRHLLRESAEPGVWRIRVVAFVPDQRGLERR